MTVTYTATDAAGNTGTATRTVNVVEIKPVLTPEDFYTDLAVETDGLLSKLKGTTGVKVTFDFTTNIEINDPTIEFFINDVKVINTPEYLQGNNAKEHRFTFIVNENDQDGLVSFTVNFTGKNGIDGDEYILADENKIIEINKQIPTLELIEDLVPGSGTNNIQTIKLRSNKLGKIFTLMENKI